MALGTAAGAAGPAVGGGNGGEGSFIWGSRGLIGANPIASVDVEWPVVRLQEQEQLEVWVAGTTG